MPALTAQGVTDPAPTITPPRHLSILPDPQPPVARFRRKTTVDDGPRDPELTGAIVSAAAGDSEALRYLYLRYKDNVYGYVRSIVCDEFEAEDVTQQVFMKLMRVLPQYENRGVPFSAWILRVARNVALDHVRARRPVPVEEVFGADTPRSDADYDRSLSLRQALAALPDDQREVVVLRHLAGLTPREIAERLGKTESSIHGLHHRGRGAIQDELRQLSSAPATRGAARVRAAAGS
jgi:RNA polymerase sigma-70 factor (ECF subfamily)